MAEPGKDGVKEEHNPSSAQQDNNGPKGSLSRPKPQGVISFNKRAQMITVAGLAIVFGLIFYGVFHVDSGGSGGAGGEILSHGKQQSAKSEGESIKEMIPEMAVLPKRVETQTDENGEAATPDWFNGDVKQEQEPQVPPPTAPAPPPTEALPEEKPEDPSLAARRAGDAAAAQAGTSLGAGFPSPVNITLPDAGKDKKLAKPESTVLQEQRVEFLRRATSNIANNYINSVPTAAISQFEIKSGWLIPAVLEHGINTDLKGMLTARVSQNVFDTATGQFLLIPQGSRLIGKYESTVNYGQERVMAGWDRIIFPDGSSVNLDNQQGVDAQGYAGFHDKVDNHYGAMIASGILVSILSAIPSYAGNYRSTSGNISTLNSAGAVVTVQNPGAQAAESASREIASIGQNIAQRFTNLQPTIEIRPGFRFYVRVQKDLAFLRPYEFGNAEPANLGAAVGSDGSSGIVQDGGGAVRTTTTPGGAAQPYQAGNSIEPAQPGQARRRYGGQ